MPYLFASVGVLRCSGVVARWVKRHAARVFIVVPCRALKVILKNVNLKKFFSAVFFPQIQNVDTEWQNRTQVVPACTCLAFHIFCLYCCTPGGSSWFNLFRSVGFKLAANKIVGRWGHVKSHFYSSTMFHKAPSSKVQE